MSANLFVDVTFRVWKWSSKERRNSLECRAIFYQVESRGEKLKQKRNPKRREISGGMMFAAICINFNISSFKFSLSSPPSSAAKFSTDENYLKYFATFLNRPIRNETAFLLNENRSSVTVRAFSTWKEETGMEMKVGNVGMLCHWLESHISVLSVVTRRLI